MDEQKVKKYPSLTIRLDDKTKAEMKDFARKHGVSFGWIVLRGWTEFKLAIKNKKIKL